MSESIPTKLRELAESYRMDLKNPSTVSLLIEAADAIDRERNRADDAVREMHSRELHHFEVETENETLHGALGKALQAHHDLHPTYGSTTACGGGIGGMVTVEDVAQFIRATDGNHEMGAGALAEALHARFTITERKAQ